MHVYVVKRLLQTIPLIVIVSFLTFAMLLMLPGDPVLALAAGGEQIDAATLEARRRELGLDRPTPVQYASWVANAVRGDFGRSTQTRRPVSQEIRGRISPTLHLGIASLALALVIGIPTGVMSALKPNSFFDRIATVGAIGGVAIPNFFFGIVLIIVFAVWLGWLPSGGFVSITDDPVRSLKLLALPTLTNGWSIAAILVRQTRSSLLEVLRQDYVRTARAKGLRERRVVAVHAMRNALLPVVTVLGLLVGFILGGSVIVEQIFSIPGMGRLLITGIFAQDFPVVQAGVLLIAMSVIFANLLTDLAYAWLDPRIRYE
jgi:peptide/nickel transport system permease protein